MLNCEGKDLEKDVLGFVGKLNHSPSFSEAYLGGENKQTGGMIVFPLTVEYHPEAARAIV